MAKAVNVQFDATYDASEASSGQLPAVFGVSLTAVVVQTKNTGAGHTGHGG